MGGGGRGLVVLVGAGPVAKGGRIKAANVAVLRVNPVATICTLSLIAPGKQRKLQVRIQHRGHRLGKRALSRGAA